MRSISKLSKYIKSARLDIIKHKGFSPYYNAFSLREVLNERLGDTDEEFETEVIKRIIKTYNSMQDKFKELDIPAYKIGKEWQGIINQHYSPLITSLTNGDIASTRKLFKNFCRSGISRGLDFGSDFDHLQRKGLDNVYINEYLKRLHIWIAFLGQERNLKELAFPAIGNPYGISIEGSLIPFCALRMHYHSSRIASLAVSKSIKHPVVCEIGGGFGGMAYYLLKNNNARFKYLDFDIPIVLSLCSYFLMLAFPNLKILLYGEEELTQESIKSYDIILMPHFQLPDIPDKSIDISFNSRSLIEMDEKTIVEYLKRITRITRYYFLHNNYLRSDDDPNLTYSGKISRKFLILTQNCLLNTDWKRSYILPSLIEENIYECLYENIPDDAGEKLLSSRTQH